MSRTGSEITLEKSNIVTFNVKSSFYKAFSCSHLLNDTTTNFVHSRFAFTQAGIKQEQGETRILCLDSAHNLYSTSYDDIYQTDIA